MNNLNTLNERIERSINDTEQWAKLASAKDEEIRRTHSESPKFPELLEEHRFFHAMALSSQGELESLYQLRERMQESRVTERVPRDVSEREKLNATLDKIEAEIAPDHMDLSRDEINRMELAHKERDESLSDEEEVKLVGESHIALHEAPDNSPNPGLKIRR